LPYAVGWAVACLVLAIVLVVTGPGSAYLPLRIFGSLAYMAVFSAILSTAFLKPLVRTFGRPFEQLHHVLAYSGLALATLHPLGAALLLRDAGLLLPQFGGWLLFLTYAGAPAIYLFHVAGLAARLRIKFAQWRLLHVLNFLAFCLATAHAWLIGSDTQRWLPRLIMLVMAAVVLGVMIKRRIKKA
jgi:hypothetical protein